MQGLGDRQAPDQGMWPTGRGVRNEADHRVLARPGVELHIGRGARLSGAAWVTVRQTCVQLDGHC